MRQAGREVIVWRWLQAGQGRKPRLFNTLAAIVSARTCRDSDVPRDRLRGGTIDPPRLSGDQGTGCLTRASRLTRSDIRTILRPARPGASSLAAPRSA